MRHDSVRGGLGGGASEALDGLWHALTSAARERALDFTFSNSPVRFQMLAVAANMTDFDIVQGLPCAKAARGGYDAPLGGVQARTAGAAAYPLEFQWEGIACMRAAAEVTPPCVQHPLRGGGLHERTRLRILSGVGLRGVGGPAGNFHYQGTYHIHIPQQHCTPFITTSGSFETAPQTMLN